MDSTTLCLTAVLGDRQFAVHTADPAALAMVASACCIGDSLKPFYHSGAGTPLGDVCPCQLCRLQVQAECLAHLEGGFDLLGSVMLKPTHGCPISAAVGVQFAWSMVMSMSSPGVWGEKQSAQCLLLTTVQKYQA